jgi:hypothetical protein
LEMVHSVSAVRARSFNWSAPMPSNPSTTASRCEDRMRIAPAPFSAVMVAVTVTRWAVPRWCPSSDRSAIA